ncbi:MAG: hypothetical protein H7301_12235 [Cryobacterium sp.]|nr:hypothetical protein [Oligoflexia bacterium]
MSRFILTSFALTVASMGSSFANQAQPVPVPEDQSLSPQVNISGVGAATFNVAHSLASGGKTQAGMNFSDSALVVGAAQRLSTLSGIGSMGLGLLTLDDTVSGKASQLFLHQAFVDFQAERFEALIGRSDNPTAHVVDFPTIRGDDLVTLTNPLDPYSNGKNSEENRYSNVTSVTLNQGLQTFENFHAQHLIDSAGIGTEQGINSFGASFEYLGVPGMEPFSRVPSFGFGYEHFTTNSGGKSGLNQIYLGGVVNLNTSVTNRWDLRFQDVVGFGSGLWAFQSVTDSYQADSNSLAASLRYLSSPFGSPGYQLALTAAGKNYFKVDRSRSYGAALTGVKRLGQGFDLVAQYMGQYRDRALAVAQSSGIAYEQTFEVGFVFNFDTTLNLHLSPRRSILNQQHQYVPN